MRAFAILSLLVLPSLAVAQECDPRKLLVVLDRSSSMTYEIDGVTKWDIAVDALGEVLGAYEDSIDFGLLAFPDPAECSPGTVQVDVGPHKGAEILEELAEPPPAAGNWTPMAQSLDVAAAHEPLAGSRDPHVLVLTDGWQWCSPYDASTRFTPVDSVRALTEAGMTVHVVGFGDGVDVLTLNRMAEAAGTAKAGCDPDGEDLAGEHCYFQADAADGLLAALEEIALEVSAETCNGVDDDCDGVVDGIVEPCETECGAGESTCDAGEWGDCSAGEPPCDGDEPGEVEIGPFGNLRREGLATENGEGGDEDLGTDGTGSEDDGYRTPGCGCNTPAEAPALLAGVVLLCVGLTRRRAR